MGVRQSLMLQVCTFPVLSFASSGPWGGLNLISETLLFQFFVSMSLHQENAKSPAGRIKS